METYLLLGEDKEGGFTIVGVYSSFQKVVLKDNRVKENFRKTYVLLTKIDEELDYKLQ